MKYVFVLDYFDATFNYFENLGVFTTYEGAEKNIPPHEVDEYYTITMFELDKKQVEEY